MRGRGQLRGQKRLLPPFSPSVLLSVRFLFSPLAWVWGARAQACLGLSGWLALVSRLAGPLEQGSGPVGIPPACHRADRHLLKWVISSRGRGSLHRAWNPNGEGHAENTFKLGGTGAWTPAGAHAWSPSVVPPPGDSDPFEDCSQKKARKPETKEGDLGSMNTKAQEPPGKTYLKRRGEDGTISSRQ